MPTLTATSHDNMMGGCGGNQWNKHIVHLCSWEKRKKIINFLLPVNIAVS